MVRNKSAIWVFTPSCWRNSSLLLCRPNWPVSSGGWPVTSRDWPVPPGGGRVSRTRCWRSACLWWAGGRAGHAGRERGFRCRPKRDPGYMSRKITKFRTINKNGYVKQTETLTHTTHVNGWEPAVYMSCMSQNFRLFHVSNLSVRNFPILFCSCIQRETAGLHRDSRNVHRDYSSLVQCASAELLTSHGCLICHPDSTTPHSVLSSAKRLPNYIQFNKRREKFWNCTHRNERNNLCTNVDPMISSYYLLISVSVLFSEFDGQELTKYATHFHFVKTNRWWWCRSAYNYTIEWYILEIHAKMGDGWISNPPFQATFL